MNCCVPTIQTHINKDTDWSYIFDFVFSLFKIMKLIYLRTILQQILEMNFTLFYILFFKKF